MAESNETNPEETMAEGEGRRANGPAMPAKREPIGAFNLPFFVYEGDVDLETCKFLKKAPELGLKPPAGPREPLDETKSPYMIIPTGHWNLIQAYIDSLGPAVREGYNKLGGVIQNLARDAIGYDDFSVPEVLMNASRMHAQLGKCTSHDERTMVIAEILLGAGGVANLEDKISDTAAQVVENAINEELDK
jgi:hypothetical protein